MAIITDHNAAHGGWHYDPLHQQPVFLFWDRETWRARFVWQDVLATLSVDQGGGVSMVIITKEVIL